MDTLENLDVDRLLEERVGGFGRYQVENEGFIFLFIYLLFFDISK